jgi:hypothetical protein
MVPTFTQLEEGRLPELKSRWLDLRSLAGQLTSDKRWLSTPLGAHDPLVLSAQVCKAPIVSPLTIGTLLASVLGEVDSVESAIKSIERRQRPGQDSYHSA